MSQGLPWGESPIDLPDEEPGETKFQFGPDQVTVLEEDMAEDDIGPHERLAAWQVPGVVSGLGWVFGALVVNSLALLLCNSHALANWADQLPIAPLTDPVVVAADDWHRQAGAWGLNTVVDRVERAANAMRKEPWPKTR